MSANQDGDVALPGPSFAREQELLVLLAELKEQRAYRAAAHVTAANAEATVEFQIEAVEEEIFRCQKARME
jgi:hypothetical protein